MKLVSLYVCVFSLLFFMSCDNELERFDGTTTESIGSEAYITQEQAISSVDSIIEQYDMVYVSDGVVPAKTPFVADFHESETVDYDAWVIMINTEPLANSGKFWRYLYVNAKTGKCSKESMEWCFSNHGFKSSVLKYGFGKGDYSLNDVDSSSICSINSFTVASNDNWAVIISGGINPQQNGIRFWNDCSAIYKCLRNNYGYQRQHIIVLMSDGTSSGLDMSDESGHLISSPLDLDGDGLDDINYSATKTNISKVFDFLKKSITAQEQLSVFVTDHGGSKKGKSFICLWNEEEFYPEDFVSELNKIDASVRKQIVLGQCFSGGFVTPLSRCSNISISTAANDSEYSWSLPGGLRDEFLYHWTEAASGKAPTADCNGYSGLSMEELFVYSKNHDNSDEHPQYRSVPNSVGGAYGYSGDFLGYPEFSAPTHLSSGNSNGYTFSVSTLPADCRVVWTPSDSKNIRMSSNTAGKITVWNNCSEAMAENNMKVDVIDAGGWVYSFSTYFYLWKPGISYTQKLIQGSLESGSFMLNHYVPNLSDDDYRWSLYEESSPQYNMFDDCEVFANNYFIDFRWTNDEVPNDYYVSVSFKNPLGEQTTVVRHYQ